MLVARRADQLEALVERIGGTLERQVQVVATGLADERDLRRVKKIIEATPDLGLIANVAGAGALGLATQIDPSAVEAMLKINVVALTRLLPAASRRFTAAGAGTITNSGSALAAFVRGETVTFPTLHHADRWDRFEAVRKQLVQAVLQTELPAQRYVAQSFVTD